MTERLYYNDAYLTRFDAQVLDCRPNGSAFDVLLDRSAFYPTSGGQPYDTGTLNDVPVTDVNVEKGLVWHTVPQAFATGAAVQGQIDWPRRFDHMQQHAGDHMIAGALHRMLGGVTIGLHISADVSTIDVALPEGATRISEEEIRRIELDVNQQIQRNVPIRCWFPSAEELETLPLRKKPTVSEHIRIVAIGDDEMVACGGTHPAHAGELGLVKILSVAPARGKMRVTFVAGQRALEDYFHCREAAQSVARLLSTPTDKLTQTVATLQDKLHAAEKDLAQYKREHLFSQLAAMLAAAEPMPNGNKLIATFVEADAGLLRELASKLVEEPGVIALLGARSGEQTLYAFARSQDAAGHMGTLLKDSAQLLGGKGGGRPDFAQGGGSEQILEHARQALLKSV